MRENVLRDRNLQKWQKRCILPSVMGGLTSARPRSPHKWIPAYPCSLLMYVIKPLIYPVHSPFFQAIIDKITNSGAGHLAVAFILCKVISPIKYAITLVGTKYLVAFLRRRGYLAPVPEEDRISVLAKESQQLIKTRIARGRQRGEARIRKTKTAVKDLKLKIKNKRMPKRWVCCGGKLLVMRIGPRFDWDIGTMHVIIGGIIAWLH